MYLYSTYQFVLFMDRSDFAIEHRAFPAMLQITTMKSNFQVYGLSSTLTTEPKEPNLNDQLCLAWGNSQKTWTFRVVWDNG